VEPEEPQHFTAWNWNVRTGSGSDFGNVNLKQILQKKPKFLAVKL
jgi:hypothetical protein